MFVHVFCLIPNMLILSIGTGIELKCMFLKQSTLMLSTDILIFFLGAVPEWFRHRVNPGKALFYLLLFSKGIFI